MSAITSTHVNGRSKTTRILIVDDHPVVRWGLANLISREADLCVCAEADGLTQALLTFRKTNPHLVITDLTLQNGNGIELVKELAAQSPEVRVLVYSMHDENLFAERALRAGAKGYVNKEETTDCVLLAIRRVRDGGVYLSECMTHHMICRNIGNGKPASEESAIEMLSDRELQVFEQIGQGATTKQIAEKLHLSPKTIETYRENVKSKLGLDNSSQLTRHAVQWVLER